MTLPTRKVCLKKFDEYHVPPNILRHCLTVNRIGRFLAEALRAKGITIDVALVDRATLLHDLMRVVDIPDGKIAFEREEDGAFWKHLKQKYPHGGHEAAAAAELQAYPLLAETIKTHRFDNILKPETLNTWEKKIVYYADKRAKFDIIVPLQERFEDGKKRNAQDRALGDEKLQQVYGNTHILETELFSIIQSNPDHMETDMQNREHQQTKAIIFDYDGVIVDSLPTVIELYKCIGKDLGIPEFTQIQNGDFFEGPWELHFKRLSKDTSENLMRAREIYFSELKKRQHEVTVFAGIPELLNQLSKRYKLAIITNSSAAFVKEHLRVLHLDHYFHSIIGHECGFKKPDERMVKHCLEHLGTKPEETIFIGDMDTDIEAALNANLRRSIGVTYGWHSKHRLRHADHLMETVEELKKEVVG
ncbi:HAD-IA family hydrolase [Candidatus Woesearchaeota archaeon]|nr:HAD-IA family hydrolase [Candidatus Woesearchaeota archaeon]